ncbi:MAG: hypothetical protein IIB77_03275 [Proteobacteria bacterium]|nr:hypothetical protein [Pseudomonadota bacterium]
MAGRPKFEITHEVLEKVEAYAGQGLTKDQIAQCLGICYDTLNERQKDNSEFSEAIKRGQAKGIETISNALFVAGKDGNITAQIFYLKNRSPKNWKDRHSTELSGPDDGPVKITVELVSKGD